MSFLDTVSRAKAYLEKHGRVSLRALRREFGLDGEALEAVVEELVDIQQIARREERSLALLRSTEPTPPACEAEASSREYTPKHLAERILSARSTLEGERKQVTVLFADVKGSMELADNLGAEEWHSILDRFFRILAESVHRYEGSVNQYTGDGIMALFGAPIAHEDHAQRACYAALHLREELQRYASELRRERGLDFSVRMGLNSGEVIVGKIGDDLRMDYTAQGHTVGLASRLEQLAEAGSAYVGECTAELVRGYFDLEDLGEFNIKGVDGPAHVHALRGVGQQRTRLDVSRARGFSRLVGRVREMEMLETALARAIEGEGQVVGVVGDAGVGKSRLCAELLDKSRLREIVVWEAHCPAHGRTIPMLPILELTRAFFGLSEHEEPAEARRRIAGTLVLLDESFRDSLPLAFDFLGVPDPAHPLPPIDPEVRRMRLLTFLQRLVQARSANEPAVLLLDDLHWIDAESDSMLSHIIDVVASTRTLLLVNFRPEYKAAWMQRSDYQQISLGPLGREAGIELLDDLVGRDRSVETIRDQILERAAGNPFFIEELANSLVEAGSLTGRRGAYTLDRRDVDLALPTTVQAVIAARVDRLGEAEKTVLENAAVIGREIDDRLLRAVVELTAEQYSAAIDSLRASEFLHERSLYPSIVYEFKHPLTQEVSYRSQLAGHRERTHARVARAIESIDAERLDERAALLAHHWENAQEPLEAARAHRRAGSRAAAREPETALGHWRRIRELLAAHADSSEVLELRTAACCQTLFASWRAGNEEAEWQSAYEEGMRLAEQTDDLRSQATLLSGLSALRGFRGEHRLQVELLEKALEVSGRCDDFALEASLHQRIGWAYTFVGDNRRALEWTERGIAFCERDPDRAGHLSGFDTYAWLIAQRGDQLVYMGRLEEARQELNRAMAITSEKPDPFTRVYALSGHALLAMLHGDFAAMKRHAQAELDLSEQSGLHTPLALTDGALADLYCGDFDVAVERCEQAVSAWRDLRGVVMLWAITLLRLARTVALACSGRSDAARESLRETESDCARYPESLSATGDPVVHLWLARALMALDGASARERIDQALSAVVAASEKGWPALVPLALHERARLAALCGEADERRRSLEAAKALFEEMGCSARAERLADELRAL